MTRLMVLGGGRHQVPLIKNAEQRGIEVVLIDYLSNAPGRELASHPTLASATDSTSAIRIAEEFEIEGVITTGTDIPIRTMAAVAASRDLPCYLEEKSALIATDKLAMAEALAPFDVEMARRELVPEGEARKGMTFPVVVKPADSQGQRGISTVRSSDRLPTALERAWEASNSRRAVVEDFLEGPELTANGWMHDGELSMLMVNDRITYNPEPFIGIAFQHRYPSLAASYCHAEVRNATEQVARAYSMEEGPLYIQMIVTDERPVVVEAAARFGGGHESRLLHHLIGWSAEDALIDIALGRTPTAPPPLPVDQHGLVNFILGSSGTVAEATQHDLEAGIDEMAWYVSPGDVLTDVTDSLGRVGYFIARAENRESLEGLSHSYYTSLTLPDSTGKNLVLNPSPESLNRP